MDKLKDFKEDIKALCKQYWGDDVKSNYYELPNQIIVDIVLNNNTAYKECIDS